MLLPGNTPSHWSIISTSSLAISGQNFLIVKFMYQNSENIAVQTNGINLQEITNENRTGLVKRWKEAQKSVDDCMHRYNMKRTEVEKLAGLTFEQIEMVAGIGYSLFELNIDERLLDLVRRAESSQELARLRILRG
jgi:hypothetical protein